MRSSSVGLSVFRGLRMKAQHIGVSVSAMMADTVTAPASVKANSVNSAPVRPLWKPIGTKTAISTTVMAMIGPPSSRAAVLAACSGFMPSRRWRLTFSTTRIASSTTSPIASTSASSVRRLIEKPSANIMLKVPTSDSGIAITGISTERHDPRKRNTTTVTIASASPRL